MNTFNEYFKLREFELMNPNGKLRMQQLQNQSNAGNINAGQQVKQMAQNFQSDPTVQNITNQQPTNQQPAASTASTAIPYSAMSKGGGNFGYMSQGQPSPQDQSKQQMQQFSTELSKYLSGSVDTQTLQQKVKIQGNPKTGGISITYNGQTPQTQNFTAKDSWKAAQWLQQMTQNDQ